MNAETIREPTIGEGSRREVFTGRAGALSESFETRRKVVVVRASRVGNGIVARNREAKDDEVDSVVAGTLNPQKARIIVMLALTKTSDTKEIPTHVLHLLTSENLGEMAAFPNENDQKGSVVRIPATAAYGSSPSVADAQTGHPEDRSWPIV